MKQYVIALTIALISYNAMSEAGVTQSPIQQIQEMRSLAENMTPEMRKRFEDAARHGNQQAKEILRIAESEGPAVVERAKKTFIESYKIMQGVTDKIVEEHNARMNQK